MLSYQAAERVLGISDKTVMSALDMAREITIAFYPNEEGFLPSSDVQIFVDKLRSMFKELGVNVIPYESALMCISWRKVICRAIQMLGGNVVCVVKGVLGLSREQCRYVSMTTAKKVLCRTKIRSGVSIVVIGEHTADNLPIEHVSSFRKSSVITILDKPECLDDKTTFQTHFDTALALFAYHMTNLVVLVKGGQWILYNFNASHPHFDMRTNFRENVLKGLIPKMAAPMRPLRLADLKMVKDGFDPYDKEHAVCVKDLVEGAHLFAQTNLFPPGKKISDLPFRSDFHRWIGSIHLDHRNGMSYGFLARQLPTRLERLVPFAEAKRLYGKRLDENRDFFLFEGRLYVVLELPQGKFCMCVPEVWVLSQRSGSDKTDPRPDTDLVKLGLKDGVRYIQPSLGLTLQSGYRTSFDTEVILAHAVANAVLASVFAHFDPGNQYAEKLRTNGSALVHWHGYLAHNHIPAGWLAYGGANLHVSCSSHQSAIYALSGRLEDLFNGAIDVAKACYNGHIHIEPHHGTNMTHDSVVEMARLLIEQSSHVGLGSVYQDAYLSDGVA